jgi:hypothetical protein
MNEEFLVSASHQLALITSLPFVHTARRYYRLNGLVRTLDDAQPQGRATEIVQTYPFRGSKSRNKVSVGEPAEGSLTNSKTRLPDRSGLSFLVKRRAVWIYPDYKYIYFTGQPQATKPRINQW